MTATRTQRYAVIGAAFVLSLITYVDRAAISSAKGPMAAELGFSDAAMGAVFSAFALGYAAAQIPCGWLADKYGPRIALASLVAVWSVLTGLTGLIHGLTAMLAVRFFFGVAEAGAFPGCARVFYNWLPPGERGIANGVLFSGALLGGALAFPFYQWLLNTWGWRGGFLLLAVPGLMWTVAWLVFFRDYPGNKKPDPSASIGVGMSFGQVFRSSAMAKAMFQYFAGNFTFYLCITWMHPFLISEYRLTPAQASTYAVIPLVAGAVANWIAGSMVDGLYRRGHHAWSRRLPALIGFSLASASIFSVAYVDTAEFAVALVALATFGVEMTISPSWAFCLDIGGRNSGAVSASMNMLGNFGGFVSANAFPLLHLYTGTPAAYFYTAGALNLIALLCWYSMRPRHAELSPQAVAAQT